MTASNSAQTSRELESLYRGARINAGVAMAYSGPGQVPIAVPGDAESAWLKVPPFTEPVRMWQPAATMSIADYVATQPVDVASVRIITVYFKMVWTAAASANAQLSFIPEHRAKDDQGATEWYTTGVVNPTITAVNPTGATYGDGFGSRTWHPAELRSPLFTGGPRTVLSKLTFDVADAESFRLQVLQNVVAQVNSTLELKYSRSQ
jgi:hypothetical protein